MTDLVVTETPVAPELAALESAEAEMKRAGVWIDLDDWHLLAQAHGRLCPRSRANSIRVRAFEVIEKLGDLDLQVEGIKVRDREPAFVVALGLELARRWRAQAGDRETKVSDEQRAKLAEKIRDRVNFYRPDGYITLTEAAELIGVNQTSVRRMLEGAHVRELAAGPYVFLRRADVEKFVASRAERGADR